VNRRIVAATATLLLFAATPPAAGQRNGFSGYLCPDPPIYNIPYDGRFTFARLKYTGGPVQCYYRG